MPKRHKTQKKYSFPILKRKVIITCMKELEIALKENDLKSPQEEKIKCIYAAVLEKLLNINVLNKQIPFNRLNLFEHPQLHESSIISVRLFREMIKFMRMVGVTDFSISDLMAPESSRTVRNLSAIINFARWRSQKFQIYLSSKAKLDELQQKYMDIIDENKRLAHLFTAAQSKIAEEAPQAESLQTEIDALKRESHGLMKTVDQTQRDIHSLKKQIKSSQTMDGEKKATLNDHIECIHDLERKIVKSPERIKKQLKALSGKIQRDKMDINGAKQRLQSDVVKRGQLKELQSMIALRFEEMQHIHHLKNERHCKAEQEVKRLQTAKAAEEKELKSSKKQHKQTEETLRKLKHEYETLMEEKQAKTKSADDKKKQVASLQQEQSRKSTSIRTQISKMDKRIEAEKERMEQMQKEQHKAIQQILSKYRQLVENVEMYHLNMRQGMDSWGY